MRARQWRNGLLIGVLLLIAWWLFSLIWGLVGKAHVAVVQANDAKRQYQELEERKATLEADLATMATALGRDTAIRTAFGVARPGEEVIVVVPSVAATATPPLSWWQRFVSWF